MSVDVTDPLLSGAADGTGNESPADAAAQAEDPYELGHRHAVAEQAVREAYEKRNNFILQYARDHPSILRGASPNDLSKPEVFARAEQALRSAKQLDSYDGAIKTAEAERTKVENLVNAARQRGATARNPNEAILAGQRNANAAAGRGGVTDQELAQQNNERANRAAADARNAATTAASLYGHNVSLETANLNYIKGMVGELVATQRLKADVGAMLIRAAESRVTQSMKRYELELSRYGMAITSQGQQAVFDAHIYGTNAGLMQRVLESQVTVRGQNVRAAIDLTKETLKADDAYWKSRAPAGTAEYLKQLALGNANAPRPTQGGRRPINAQDVYDTALATVGQGQPDYQNIVDAVKGQQPAFPGNRAMGNPANYPENPVSQDDINSVTDIATTVAGGVNTNVVTPEMLNNGALPTFGNSPTNPAQVAPGTRYSAEQVAAAMRKAGFPEDQIPTGIGVVMAESGGQAASPNEARQTGERSRGPWQIDLNQHGGIDEAGTRDLDTSTRKAYEIWKEGGWNRWTTYRTGAYRQYANQGGQ